MICRAELVHGVDKGADLSRISVLRYAMTEIEYVARPVTESGQHIANFAAQRVAGRKQRRRIEVPLQRDAASDSLPRDCDVDGPIQTDGVRAYFSDLFQPSTTAFGEHDARDALAGR